MLIVTLPQAHRTKLLEEIISHSDVDIVRYNTGMRYGATPMDVVAEITRLTRKYGKQLWLDLKGRQLRNTVWSDVPNGPIILNHRISVALPAKVYLRGEEAFDLAGIKDERELLIDGVTKYMVGAGQSINIVSDNLRTLDGYFIPDDLAFIEAGKLFGVTTYLFSYSEFEEDIPMFFEALKGIKGAKAILKLESRNGLNLMRTLKRVPKRCRYMAARDDLAIEVGNLEAIRASREIVTKDPEAILASRILKGLEVNGKVSFSDVADLELARSFGYKHFMLSDGVSQKHFKEAMEFWVDYKKEIS